MNNWDSFRNQASKFMYDGKYVNFNPNDRMNGDNGAWAPVVNLVRQKKAYELSEDQVNHLKNVNYRQKNGEAVSDFDKSLLGMFLTPTGGIRSSAIEGSY